MERSRASYAVLALLVAASLAMTVWVVGARHELRQVEAAWAGAPACTGANVKPHRDGWVIGARPGMRCQIEIEVTNRSGHDVHLDSVVAPLLDVNRVVRDGRTVTVAVGLGFGDLGCGMRLASTGHWPELAVSLWHRTEEVVAADTLHVRNLGVPCDR